MLGYNQQKVEREPGSPDRSSLEGLFLRGFSIAERSEMHAKETKEALPVSGLPEPRGA
jgi:hypothetical protein